MVTTTSTVVMEPDEGESAISSVGLTHCTEAAGSDPKATVEARVKPVPVMVTLVPPARGPRRG